MLTFFFYFQNNPKDLDPSYKMDLDLGAALERLVGCIVVLRPR